jgi:dienelactone hydrolase
MRWKLSAAAATFVLLGLALHDHAMIAWRSAAMVLYFVPGQVPQPLDTFGEEIRIEHSQFVDRAGRTIPMTFYVPQGAGRHPGILVVHGWIPGGDQAPDVVHAVTGLARAGHVVAVPRLIELINGVVDPADIDALADAGAVLSERPDVDRSRIGVIGVCLGATEALAAADDPKMPPLRVVSVINAYYDIIDLLQGVTTHTNYVQGRLVEWRPGPQVEHVVNVNARELAKIDPSAAPKLQAILENRDPARVRELFDALPADTRQRLEVASPADFIGQLHTRVVFVQALADPVVPPDSLRHFELRLGDRAITSGFANSALQHNTLEQPGLDPRALFGSYLPGLAQLSWLTYEAMNSLDG